jgi:hypothetical protein
LADGDQASLLDHILWDVTVVQVVEHNHLLVETSLANGSVGLGEVFSKKVSGSNAPCHLGQPLQAINKFIKHRRESQTQPSPPYPSFSHQKAIKKHNTF